MRTSQQTPPLENKAAIIDQLASEQPDPDFYLAVQEILVQHEISTYYYGYGAIDVDFYKNLPQMGCKLLIFRVHAALNDKVNDLALFTDEQWSDEKASSTYLSDVWNDRIVPVARTLEPDAQKYFGVTSKFIKESMNGRFDNVMIIMMGCDTLSTNKMAETFVKEKGAKFYTGWTGLVGAQHTDKATKDLIEALLEGKNVEAAINEAMNKNGADPNFDSTLSWYPIEAGSTKLTNSHSENKIVTADYSQNSSRYIWLANYAFQNKEE